jgi:hypothetical protein
MILFTFRVGLPVHRFALGFSSERETVNTFVTIS